MINEPTEKELAIIPRLYSTEKIPLKYKKIYLHFFLSNSNWYISEYDGQDIFFGFVCLNGLKEFAEWGNISFKELKELKINIPNKIIKNKTALISLEVERNLNFKPKMAYKIQLICQCQGW